MTAARAAVLIFLLGCSAARPVLAQTLDPIFAGVRWAPRTPGSRPAGLGGAFAVVADGGKAAYFNPAGLAQLPLKEFEISSGDPWLSLGGKLGPVRLGAYATRFEEAEAERGGLARRFSEVGVSVAAAPLHRLKLGVAAAWSGLEVAGSRAAVAPSGQETTLVELSGDDTQVRVTAGALLTLFST